jgi:hypothetical protein
MNAFRLILLAAAAALAAPPAMAAQEQDIVVNGHAARAEIERILNADNLDTDNLEPRDVADTMAAIQRGGAPDDFWNAYQAHVRAWSLYADEVEQAGNGSEAQPDSVYGFDQVSEAQAAIASTFDEVERIAHRYGARLPMPIEEVRSMV